MSKISYGPQNLDSKLTNLLKPLFAGDKKNFLIINNLVKNWEEIVGKKYAKLSYPKSINFEKNKQNQAKLTIAVFNSSAGFGLENNSEFLLEKIAKLYGYKAIHKIIIKQETQEIKTKSEEKKIDPEKEKLLQEKIKNIQDEELARILERLGREIV